MGAVVASPGVGWGIVAAAMAGVILRPFGWPDFVWAIGGAALLVAMRQLSMGDAWAGIGEGREVYLFLVGMMLLSALAQQEGLFAWVAARAALMAHGSGARLFTLVFGVATLVTIFLSNDATAVVLTPAVAAVVKAAKAQKPLPYLFICAFVANAASFVLPISNPANLVVYGSKMPPLLHWLPLYGLPSVLAIMATYGVLRWSQRGALRQAVSAEIEVPTLSVAGRMAAGGIVGTAFVLLWASAFDIQLGWPIFLASGVTALLVLTQSNSELWGVVKSIGWDVLPLVAGLFVLVAWLEKSGVTAGLAALLRGAAQHAAGLAAWAAGLGLAFGCNLVNNLPAGLVAGRAVAGAHVPEAVRSAVLIGVDLGPNLSVTGSLATILWLSALRREGHHVRAWDFFKLGALVMPPALILAVGAALVVG